MYVFQYILQVKSMYWYILQGHKFVCTGMYWYVPVYDIWYWISLVSEGYIRGHTGDSWVHTLSSWIFCKRAGPSRFACRGFMHQHMHLTNAHYIRFINCCLAAPLPVPASARPGAGAGLLGAAEGPLCPTRLHDDQWPARDALCVASSNGRLKDLSFKIWRWSWWAVLECWGCDRKILKHPASFRDLIREIKQWADLGWSWDVKKVIGTSTMSSDWNVKPQERIQNMLAILPSSDI
jgi:hypothetical protein